MSKESDTIITPGSVFTWRCSSCGRSGHSTFHLAVPMSKVEQRINEIHTTTSPHCKSGAVIYKDHAHSAKPAPQPEQEPTPPIIRRALAGSEDSGEMSEGELSGIIE